jgi:hypothetical protein
VIYDGQRIEAGYRLDLLVERRVVVEVKAVENLADIHRAQLLSYLKLGGYRLGYLLNFNVSRMKGWRQPDGERSLTSALSALFLGRPQRELLPSPLTPPEPEIGAF